MKSEGYSLKWNMELENSYQEIANVLGVSYQAIQQTEQKALRNFKQKFCRMYPDTWKLIKKDIESGHFG